MKGNLRAEETSGKQTSTYTIRASFALSVSASFNAVLIVAHFNFESLVLANFFFGSLLLFVQTALGEALDKWLILRSFRLYKRLLRYGLVEEQYIEE